MDDTVKIYKNLGNGYLDSIPVYRLANVHASAVTIAQINNYIEPYATFYGTTSNKDDIILRQGDSIRIYNNNNDNSTTLSTIIYTGSAYSVYRDFKISDLNNDGYNDLVVVEENYGINIYKNNSGSINTVPSYRNVDEGFFHTFSVAVGDFDGNGWNDIVVCLSDRLNLYINNKSDSLFSHSESESFHYDTPLRFSCKPLKSEVADLYNKGGLAVLFSDFGDIQDLTENDPLNEIEQLARINPSDTDAVPAPPIVFKSVSDTSGNIHPRLLIYNRGERDFQKYKIYRKIPTGPRNFYLLDSTFSGTEFIDTSRTLVETSSGTPPANNLFYYVNTIDNSFKASISSDTIGYPDVICPNCSEGERPILFSESPEKIKISNYPNPFNPVTRIQYSLPFEVNVRITVYNAAGQELKVLVNEYQKPGSYNIVFDGMDFSSGIYFYKIEAGTFIQTNKMLLLK
jgi:FG-GAP-like repeat/Secretion system C-terminal sorting domain